MDRQPIIAASPDAPLGAAQWTPPEPQWKSHPPVAASLERVVALAIAIGAVAVLAFAGTLKPSHSGYGTHMQTGLPSCGWLSATGYPCPTCGMTTAFSHAARGDLASAFRVQPFGAALAIAVAAAFWVCMTVVLAGSRSGSACGKLLSGRVLWLVAGVWAVSWAYTIATWPRG